MATFLCACGRMDVTVTLRATTTGTTIEDIYTLALRRGDLESTNEPKLRTFAGDTLTRTVQGPSPQFKVEITGNPNDLAETYHYLGIVGDPISGGTAAINRSTSVAWLTDATERGTNFSFSIRNVLSSIRERNQVIEYQFPRSELSATTGTTIVALSLERFSVGFREPPSAPSHGNLSPSKTV
jgi:hypothetical protein